MIKIKHNIKREGRTLRGQILDCRFGEGTERGDEVDYFSTSGKKLYLTSSGNPELWADSIFVWGNQTKLDLLPIYYTYPTEKAAQDMLDFINTFVEKEEPVREQAEKKYKLVECSDGKTLDEIAEKIKKLQEAQNDKSI